VILISCIDNNKLRLSFTIYIKIIIIKVIETIVKILKYIIIEEETVPNIIAGNIRK
jgi:hypothetical protein